MELYTSALWHLEKDVQLSVVAEALHSSNKTSPQALCAMSSVMNRYTTLLLIHCYTAHMVIILLEKLKIGQNVSAQSLCQQVQFLLHV